MGYGERGERDRRGERYPRGERHSRDYDASLEGGYASHASRRGRHSEPEVYVRSGSGRGILAVGLLFRLDWAGMEQDTEEDMLQEEDLFFQRCPFRCFMRCLLWF